MNLHMMELANEIAKLRRENEKLKQQLDNSAPVEMVRGLKNDLHTALARNDEKDEEIYKLKIRLDLILKLAS